MRVYLVRKHNEGDEDAIGFSTLEAAEAWIGKLTDLYFVTQIVIDNPPPMDFAIAYIVMAVGTGEVVRNYWTKKTGRIDERTVWFSNPHSAGVGKNVFAMHMKSNHGDMDKAKLEAEVIRIKLIEKYGDVGSFLASRSVQHTSGSFGIRQTVFDKESLEVIEGNVYDYFINRCCICNKLSCEHLSVQDKDRVFDRKPFKELKTPSFAEQPSSVVEPADKVGSKERN